MKLPIRAATTLVAAVSSIALLGAPAFAGGHRGNVHQHNGNVSVLSGNLNKNKVNALSGDLNNDNVLSGDNVNAPVTVAPNVCGAGLALVGAVNAQCFGNFQRINVGGQNVVSQNAAGQNAMSQHVRTAPAPHPRRVASVPGVAG